MKKVLKRFQDIVQDVGDAVLLLLVVFVFYLVFEVWVTLRRKLIILVWGYGGDVVEKITETTKSLFRALVDTDYAREIIDP